MPRLSAINQSITSYNSRFRLNQDMNYEVLSKLV